MRTHTGIITRETCNTKTLVFYPKSISEAEFIQNQLFELGVLWNGDSAKLQFAAACVGDGITVSEGVIFFGSSESDRKKGLLCTSAQFDPPYDASAELLERILDLPDGQRQNLLKKLAEKCGADFSAVTKRAAPLQLSPAPQQQKLST